MSYNYQANKEEAEQNFIDCAIDQSRILSKEDYSDLMQVREILVEE